MITLTADNLRNLRRFLSAHLFDLLPALNIEKAPTYGDRPATAHPVFIGSHAEFHLFLVAATAVLGPDTTARLCGPTVKDLGLGEFEFWWPANLVELADDAVALKVSE